VGYTALYEEYLYGTLTDYMYTFTNAKTRGGKKSLNFVIKRLFSSFEDFGMLELMGN